jgi:hypothetical protein
MNSTGMGRHRRHDAGLPVVGHYEQLVVLLHTHRPGKRSGRCLVCGPTWPCPDIWGAVEALADQYEEKHVAGRAGKNLP